MVVHLKGVLGQGRRATFLLDRAMAANQQQIREVWASNLETEMDIIRDLLPKYPFIAMVRYGLRSASLTGF